jgi:hypothetical protein
VPTGQYLSLVDLARRTDPDGEAADIAELLSQANEIYDDLVWKEGNTNTGHVYTMRTSIPKGWWRFIGQGVPGSKSTTAQGRVNCGDLEMNSTIDLKLIEMARDQNQFRYEEDNAILQGASETIGGQFFYGNGMTNPASFTGLSNYYNTLETATAANAANVFDGGGRGANNASLWLIGWSPRSIYGTFPRGMKAGVELTPLDEVVLAYDSLGNPYRAKITWFRQMAGLCVEDWRWGVRIANLDVTNAAAGGLAGPNAYDIFAGLSKAVLRLPKMARGDSGITETDARNEKGMTVRPAIYANRQVRGFMDIQAIRDRNVLLGPKDYAGEPVTSFRMIPIRVQDQLLSTETQVT